jgi:hypothetical protein
MPRGRWRVVSLCEHGYPRVIAVAPLLEDGVPFPTTFWLTCPHLVEVVHALESAGEHRGWTERAATDPTLASLLRVADEAYRAARRAEGAGVDPCATVGVAGQADPLAVKCLHARVAAALAGTGDPVGEGVLARLAADGVPTACDDAACDRAVTSS